MNQTPEETMYEIRIFFDVHQRRILKELKQKGIPMSLEAIPLILDATNFLQRKKLGKEVCPCYETPKPCHNNIPLEEFSCFLCGCPNYESQSDIGGCRIGSKEGIMIPFPLSPKGILLDCSSCNHPTHKKEVVEKYIRTHLTELKKMYDTV